MLIPYLSCGLQGQGEGWVRTGARGRCRRTQTNRVDTALPGPLLAPSRQVCSRCVLPVLAHVLYGCIVLNQGVRRQISMTTIKKSRSEKLDVVLISKKKMKKNKYIYIYIKNNNKQIKHLILIIYINAITLFQSRN